MRVWPISTLAVLTLLACTSTFAADDAKPDDPKPDAPKPAEKEKGDKKEKEGKGKHAVGGAEAAQIYKLALAHGAEIALTDEQKQKLLKLKTTIDELQDKLKNDPELASLHAQMKDARKNDDKDKAKEINRQIRELTDKKSGDTLQTALKDADGVLTAEQTAKLKDIQKQEREKKTADKADKNTKENAAAPANPPATEKAPEAKPAEAPKTAEAPKSADPAPADNGMGK